MSIEQSHSAEKAEIVMNLKDETEPHGSASPSYVIFYSPFSSAKSSRRIISFASAE